MIRKRLTQMSYNRFKCRNCGCDCFLCNVEKYNIRIKREYDYWWLLENTFPYDRFCKGHDLLCLKRHAESLTKKETDEFNKIYRDLSNKYNCIAYNFVNSQSIKNHLHYHLLNYKNWKLI